MKMYAMMATAALVIGCDDDNGKVVDSTDASETSEITPDAAEINEIEEIEEIEETSGPDTTLDEVMPDVDAVAPEVDEVTDDTSDIDVETPAPIELIGVWSSGFGDEIITETNWDGYCVQAIADFDNDANIAILETISGDGCLPGFSRVVWNEVVDNALDYCTTTYAATTAEEAANAPVEGFSSDLTTGCGGFPWSHLTRK